VLEKIGAPDAGKAESAIDAGLEKAWAESWKARLREWTDS